MSRRQLRKLHDTTPSQCWRGTSRLFLDGINGLWLPWWRLRGWVEVRRRQSVIGSSERFIRLTRKGRCVARRSQV